MAPQTPAQRQANERFARAEARKMGKTSEKRSEISEKASRTAQKTPSKRILPLPVILLIGFLLFGTLIIQGLATLGIL